MSQAAERWDLSYTQNRELSWLAFDQRVLEEAADPSVPLMERLRFLSIFTSNLDEFFMIRVGSIYDMTLVKKAHVDTKSGLTPAQQLAAILAAVGPLYKQRDKVVSQLETRLRACNICGLTISELDAKEKKQVERYFRDYIVPVLSPQVVDAHHPFPHLPSKSLNVAMTLRRGEGQYFGIVPIPKSLPPFLQLSERGLRYLLIEQIVQEYAGEIFDQYQVVSKAVISVTRNADISPEDEDYDVSGDFRQHMRKVLKKRARLAPVRLEIQGAADEALLSFLCQRLNLAREQVFRTKAPIDMGYVYALEDKLPPESAAALRFAPFAPRFPMSLNRGEKLIPQILRRDALLYYPYHSMDPFLQLVKEAAHDPAVLSVKITIYRLASKAKLIEYLAAAAENGKDVTVLMELRARFDEQNNIAWAERLEEAGCTVQYGFEGVKVHSKICLITRRERGHIQHITQVGTGNYNEKTAEQYTDLMLLTSAPAIGRDAAKTFDRLARGETVGETEALWLAPEGYKPQLMAHIEAQTRLGPEGYIGIKVNSMNDADVMARLVRASEAGTEVELFVRGICCLRPGVPGRTEHISVRSIIGRYLEHERIFVFGRGEAQEVFIGSGDLLERNTMRRIEAFTAVTDPNARAEVLEVLSAMRHDNRQAWIMQPDGSYLRPEGAGEPFASQAYLHTYFAGRTVEKPAPPAPPQPRKKLPWWRRLWIWLKNN